MRISTYCRAHLCRATHLPPSALALRPNTPSPVAGTLMFPPLCCLLTAVLGCYSTLDGGKTYEGLAGARSCICVLSAAAVPPVLLTICSAHRETMQASPIPTRPYSAEHPRGRFPSASPLHAQHRRRRLPDKVLPLCGYTFVFSHTRRTLLALAFQYAVAITRTCLPREGPRQCAHSHLNAQTMHSPVSTRCKNGHEHARALVSAPVRTRMHRRLAHLPCPVTNRYETRRSVSNTTRCAPGHGTYISLSIAGTRPTHHMAAFSGASDSVALRLEWKEAGRQGVRRSLHVSRITYL